MLLLASDPYSLYNPSECGLRVYLRQIKEGESPPGPYQEVLRRLGERHETTHLATFTGVVDLRDIPRDERVRRTIEAVGKGSQVIYQGALRATTTINGVNCEIVGEPDFLIRDAGNHIVRDSKISRRITEKDHPEILRQLSIYGWLYEQTFKKRPLRLEVHSGTGDIVPIPYDEGRLGFEALQQILFFRQMKTEPYTPVGWTKCNGCGFYERCWPRAEERRDVALVSGVDQGLAIGLRREGVETIPQLISNFDEKRLEEFKRPWGSGTRKVGKDASSILRMAQAMASDKELLIKAPDIPTFPNYVMFDIEGLPPHLDEFEKIYLWGLQVYGANPGSYKAALAGFGIGGDQEGWEAFLDNAKAIFEQHGDIRFVHWHHYEKTFLNKYIDRYGDKDDIAKRVRSLLLDLLPITENSIALPLPSYSLKVVEKYIGFRRSQTEYGGDWAMAKYIEATETQDEKLRQEVLEQIQAYNREDLDATWAVLKWLLSKSPKLQ